MQKRQSQNPPLFPIFFFKGRENTAFQTRSWKLKAKRKMWALAILKSVLGLKFNQKEVFVSQLVTRAPHTPQSLEGKL